MINEKKAILLTVAAVFAVALFLAGCDKDKQEYPFPIADISVVLDPNSARYQELNVIGGWMYLGYPDGIDPPSRGVIVHRVEMDRFVAYERTPVYEPNTCCQQGGDCTHLVVDYPFVNDTCNGSQFLLIDGSVIQGPATLPLLQYIAEYDGLLLHIYN